MVAELSAVPGLLTVADRGVLELYSRTMARYRACEALVDAQGVQVIRRNDEGIVVGVVANPAAVLGMRLAALARSFALELGLTPSTRARMRQRPAENGDPARAGDWRVALAAATRGVTSSRRRVRDRASRS